MEKIRKNKEWMYYMFLILLPIAFVLPFFWGGIKMSDDIAFHTSRFNSLVYEMRAGNFFPFMYNFHHFKSGYILGAFYPDFFLRPFAALNLLGLPIRHCVMLYTMFFMVFSAIGTYYCTKRILTMEHVNHAMKMSFIISMVSIFDITKVINLYRRGAIAEMAALTFIPFVILGVYYIFKGEHRWWVLALSVTAVLYSHIISAVFVVISLLLFYLANIKTVVKNKRILVETIYAALLSMLLSVRMIVPMLEILLTQDLFFEFIEVKGPISGSVIIKFDLPLWINLTIIGVITAIIVFMRKKIDRIVESVAVELVLLTDIFPWKYLEKIIPLQFIQFVWRIVPFFNIVVAVFFIQYLVENKNTVKKAFSNMWYVPLACILIPNLILASHLRVLPPNRHDNAKIPNFCNSGLLEYYPLKMGKPTIEYYMKNQMECLDTDKYTSNYAEMGKPYTAQEINEEIKIKQEIRKDNSSIFHFEGNKGEKILLNLVYYKGYSVKVNGVEVPYEESDVGCIQLSTPVEDGFIEAKYVGTPIQHVSLAVSWLTMAGFAVGMTVMAVKKKEA